MQRIHIIIQGYVQGVTFRYFVKHHAVSLGIKGFVRNLDNDKVEVIAEGEASALKKLIELCRKGPPLARVEKLEIDYEQYSGSFTEFSTG